MDTFVLLLSEFDESMTIERVYHVTSLSREVDAD